MAFIVLLIFCLLFILNVIETFDLYPQTKCETQIKLDSEDAS